MRRILLGSAALALCAAAAVWRGCPGRGADALERSPIDGERPSGELGLPDEPEPAARSTPEDAGPGAGPSDGALLSPEPAPPAQLGGRIVGRVYGAEGEPEPGAVVTAATQGGDVFAPTWSAVCDRDGFFTLSGVAPGTHDLGVRAADATLGWTVVGDVTVLAGETSVFDVVLAGLRTLSGAFEFSAEWAEMDSTLIRVELWRSGDRERPVARAQALTAHGEPWRSGEFRFSGLAPGRYELEAHPFVEDDGVWREELDLTLESRSLEPRELLPDGRWRVRGRVEPPEDGSAPDDPPPREGR